MNICMDKTEGQRNVEAIERAITSKQAEVSDAAKKLNDVMAELRGLKAALDVVKPKAT